MSDVSIALLIFGLAYLIIVTERIHKTIVALCGAALMIGSGVLTQEEAFYSHEFGVDYNVIFLLIGMMVLSAALVFGSRHVYFPAKQNGEMVRCSLAYESLPGRNFVNHGNAVYAGDGITLTPEDEVNCETVAALLNAVRRALAPSDSAGPSRA